MAKSILIGIAGGSASGKTTLAEVVIRDLGEDRTGVLLCDDYYRDVSWRNTEEVRSYDFDRPEALEIPLLAQHLRRLSAGHAIEVPRYDFGTHRRRLRSRHMEPQPVTLVDGLLLLAMPEIRDLLDLRVFVDTPADLRLARRILRDTVERHRDVRDVIRQYLETVRPAYEELVGPSKQFADLVVEGVGDYEKEKQAVRAKLEPLLGP